MDTAVAPDLHAAPTDPRATIGAMPIPGDAPAGQNIRYDTDFTTLQDEVAKFETAGPTAVKWRDVADSGLAILQNRSKDLLVAVWVALALARVEGFRGLSIGLTIIGDMVDIYWELMEPPAKRERARASMIDWLVERVIPILPEQTPPESDWDDVLAGFAAVERLDTALGEKLVNNQASIGPLIRPLRDQARAIERARAERASAAKAASEAAAAAASAPAAPPPPPPAAAAPVLQAPLPTIAPPADSAAIDTTLSRMQSMLSEVALGVINANNADPRGYLLMRQAAWGTIRVLPVNQGGKTPLPPPAKDRITQYAALQQAANHAEMIVKIETGLTAGPFWLDGQCMVANSLKAMGDTHRAAALAVAGALGGLLRRFPDLIDFAFSDGTPFADTDTRAWIAAEVSGGGSGDQPMAAGDAAPWVDAAKQARAAARGGKPRDGMALLSTGAQTAPSGRERMQWQLAAAELCLEFALPAPALSILDHLDREVDRYGLESWEPAVALRVSQLMHRCLLREDVRPLRKDEQRLTQLEQHRARMARLDLVAVLEALKI